MTKLLCKKDKLDDDVRGHRIIRFYRDRFHVLARRLACFDFYFDSARLTRREDFREVHSSAPSARLDGAYLKLRLARVFDYKRAAERFILRLLSEV